MTAIIGEYIQLQTYKEKPYVTLHIDCPEEMAGEIVKAIGWKKSGESIYLGVTRMNQDAIGGYLKTKVEKSEPKLSQTAGWRCQSTDFQAFCGARDEAEARIFLLDKCGIESRTELCTNKKAADIFLAIVNEFETYNKRSAF